MVCSNGFSLCYFREGNKPRIRVKLCSRIYCSCFFPRARTLPVKRDTEKVGCDYERGGEGWCLCYDFVTDHFGSREASLLAKENKSTNRVLLQKCPYYLIDGGFYKSRNSGKVCSS